jgi:hypothetical protein
MSCSRGLAALMLKTYIKKFIKNLIKNMSE